jgi:hypothetical protein
MMTMSKSVSKESEGSLFICTTNLYCSSLNSHINVGFVNDIPTL